MPSSTASWASDAPSAAEGLLSPPRPTGTTPLQGWGVATRSRSPPLKGRGQGWGLYLRTQRRKETLFYNGTQRHKVFFSESLRLCVPIKKNFVSSCLCVPLKQKTLRHCVPLKGCSSYSSSSQSSKNRALAFSVAASLPKSPSKPLAQSMPQSFNSMALVAGLSYIFFILKPFIFLSLLFRYECRHPSVSAC